MVTTKQAWIGLVVLLLVILLVIFAMVYWQHVTGVNAWHLLASIPLPGSDTVQGC
jgi:hypothetical protein